MTLDIDWGALALVTVVTLVATVVIVTFYSVGLRLLAVRGPSAVPVHATPGADAVDGPRPLVATIGAWLCIAVGVAAVLYGIYLVIPLFH
jgi:hypothetical protein